MKVRVFDDVLIRADCIVDCGARKLLLDNGFGLLKELREKVVDVDLNEIILSDDVAKRGLDYEMGFTYSNRLYDLIHAKHKLRGSDYDLQFEIIEEGFLDDIPDCDTIFKAPDEFIEWMKEKYKEDNQ